jgi:hypothetical protein
MFSKLVFAVESIKIEFHLHEIVKIAQQIVDDTKDEKIVIPSKGMYQKILMTAMNGMGDQDVINGKIDQFLLIPMVISKVDNIKKWLYVARQLKIKYEKEPLKGWWINIGYRLVLIKNIPDQLFYVSDHGHFEELLKYYRTAFFDLPWLENPQYIAELKNSFDIISQQSSEEQEKFKKEFDKKYGIDWSFDDIQRMFNYFSHIVLSRSYKLFSLPNSPFNVVICDRFKANIEAANQMIRRIVLLDIAKDINDGTCEPLVRPVSSYGAEKKGNSYHEFEKSISNYFELQNHLKSDQLAALMRYVLAGGTLKNNDVAFLPNLAGAWFIAETARNPMSLLTGLILIDMLENGIESNDEKGNNWYSWSNTLIHPHKRCGIKEVKDLYGSKVGIDRFGGSHPMVHGGSVNEASRSLSPKRKLTTVRQKEGSLLLHWLCERISHEKKNYDVSLIKVNYDDSTSFPESRPVYDEIAEINKNSSKLESTNKKIIKLKKTIDKKQNEDNADVKKESDKITELNTQKLILEKKQQLQKELIEPLLRRRMSTTENLLFLAKGRGQNNFPNENRTVPSSKLLPVGLNYQDIPGDDHCLYNANDPRLLTQKKLTVEVLSTVQQPVKILSESQRVTLQSAIQYFFSRKRYASLTQEQLTEYCGLEKGPF